LRRQLIFSLSLRSVFICVNPWLEDNRFMAFSFRNAQGSLATLLRGHPALC
jgi:hypothetical protein